MNDASASAGIGHIRDLGCRRLAAALLAVSVLCGTVPVHAEATQAAPIKSLAQPTCASDTDTGRRDVQAKPVLKHPMRKDAVSSKACPATPKQQHTDNGARGMALLLGILLTPRHGT